jgi:hypothetical protein
VGRARRADGAAGAEEEEDDDDEDSSSDSDPSSLSSESEDDSLLSDGNPAARRRLARSDREWADDFTLLDALDVAVGAISAEGVAQGDFTLSTESSSVSDEMYSSYLGSRIILPFSCFGRLMETFPG